MATGSPNPVVLVVDDEAMIRVLVEALLRQQGVEALSAATGDEALDLFTPRAHEVTGALLDVNLPDTDGLTLLGDLRALKPDLRCWFMSGASDPGLLPKVQALGALGLLEKPFADLSALSAALRQLAS